MELSNCLTERRILLVLAFAATLPPAGVAAQQIGSGAHGSVGHTAFEMIGLNESATFFEVMPYLYQDSQLLFSETRLYTSNEGELGGNLGLGYRGVQSDIILGGSLRYDGDHTTQKMFHQVGASLEAISPLWEVRTNGYLPVGNTSQNYSFVAYDSKFVDNHLLYNQTRQYGEALPGGDIELGLAIPYGFLEPYRLRTYVGGYHFVGDTVPNVTGVKGRIAAQLTDAVSIGVAGSHDETFGTNVNLTVAIHWGFNEPLEDVPLSARILEFTRRNFNIIVSEGNETHRDLLAHNPQTGLPYVVQHVSDLGVESGTGRVDDPFASLAEAQEAGGDIIHVHSGTVFTEGVIASTGTRILGEGSPHYFAVAGFDSIVLPSATGGDVRPIIMGASGDGVTLVDGSEVSGFTVIQPAGYGIVANQVVDAVSRHMTIEGAILGGIDVEESASLYFDGISVTAAGGFGVNLVNNTGDIRFGSLSIHGCVQGGFKAESNSTGHVFIADLDIDSHDATALDVRDTRMTVASGRIVASSGTAISIEDADLDVTLNSVSSNNTNVGISVIGSTGQFRVIGSGGVGSGGTIADVDIGVQAVDSERIEIRGIHFDSNGNAVATENVDGLVLRNSLVEKSISVDVATLNTRQVVVDAVEFARGGNSSIAFQAQEVSGYELSVKNSVFDTDSGSSIVILGDTAASGSHLGLAITGNSIQTHQEGADAIALSWDGASSVDISGNSIVGTNNNQSGIAIDVGSNGSYATIYVYENNITMDGGNAIGMVVDVAMVNETVIYANTLRMDGDASTGVQLSLEAPTAAGVTWNDMAFYGNGGTAVRFDEVAGDLDLLVDGNSISFKKSSSIPDEAFVFENATGTVTLYGDYDNSVEGAETMLSAPSGSLSGGFWVNGIERP